MYITYSYKTGGVEASAQLSWKTNHDFSCDILVKAFGRNSNLAKENLLDAVDLALINLNNLKNEKTESPTGAVS